MNIEKWKTHEFSTGSFAGKDYLTFQQQMKTDLKKRAADMGFELTRFDPNHYEFSAVLSKQVHEEKKYIYVSISDVRFFKNAWADHVLVRTMAHDKDWTGGRNTYCRWDQVLEQAERLIDRN